MSKFLPWVLIAIAAVAGVSIWESRIKNKATAAVKQDYTAQAVTVDVARAAVAAPVIEAVAKEQIRIVIKTKTIIKEIPVYVKATDCPMPGGFRLLHDAAAIADAEVPDPARIADAAPAPAQDVARTVTENYAACHANAEDLRGLQDWLRRQETLSTK